MRADIREDEWQRLRAGADPTNHTEADFEVVRGPREFLQHVDTIDEAHGIWFLCPLCFAANSGRIGTHMVMCGFAGRAPAGTMSKNSAGADSRWEVSGTGYHDLTLKPSVHLDGEGGCGWHGFVTNGEAA